MQERFPLPRFFITKTGDTNERKIKVRVNPSSLTAKNSTVEVIICYLTMLEWKLLHRRCEFKCIHAEFNKDGRADK